MNRKILILIIFTCSLLTCVWLYQSYVGSYGIGLHALTEEPGKEIVFEVTIDDKIISNDTVYGSFQLFMEYRIYDLGTGIHKIKIKAIDEDLVQTEEIDLFLNQYIDIIYRDVNQNNSLEKPIFEVIKSNTPTMFD